MRTTITAQLFLRRSLGPPYLRYIQSITDLFPTGSSSGSKLVMKPLASRMKPCSMPLESK